MINFVKKHEEVFEYLDLDVGFPPKYSDDSSRPIDIYTTNLPYNNDLNYSLKYPVSMDVKVVERFYNTIVNTLGRYTIIKLYGPMAKDAISALRQEVYAGWYDYAKLMVPDKLDKKSIKDRLPANVGDYLEYLYNYDESRRD